MRWEKLFADLEAMSADDELAERDALVNDLRDGERAATTWLDLTGGRVALEVAGLDRIEGDLLGGNDELLHVRTARAHVLVNPASLMAVVRTTGRPARPSAISTRLGWRSALRMLQRDQDRIKVCRTDGTVRSGTVEMVGADFVSVRDESGSAPMIPFAGIATVSCPR